LLFDAFKTTNFYFIDGNAIQDYQLGIINLNNLCIQTKYAVVIVGYGIDSTIRPYLLTKNSWNICWGENGYMRVVVQDNAALYNCFINSSASRPFKNKNFKYSLKIILKEIRFLNFKLYN
jgi:hypothetical protein